ncbi:aminotransferase class III-fold pyridoxal phosphate-dependent enzyme [Candidatus Peregrinibacteria bacterium]|nr:aminotransferase class III-fold pyridoxal phosphate-dependent enzyme [Candidatus Peregrinibacteria bacterium]
MSNQGQNLYKKAKTLIPGGTQLLSKRPERFLPDLWPAYYDRAKGVDIWDLDGNHYIDMCISGIGACMLGAADPDVDTAVRGAIEKGTMATLNCPEEVELAELLIELHPWAEQVRYSRCGGEAMAVAVRIARAKTGRDIVAFCGYHGWHDWYLAANIGSGEALKEHLLPGLEPSGVPRALGGTALPFRYNHLEELEAIVKKHGENLAAIIMEPIRGHDPQPGFLEGVRAIANRTGAVFVFDEVSAGFRLTCGGAHLLFGVTPDMAVFAKGMSNGYPMAAIIGTQEVMSAAEKSFISSTYWTERIGPVAALATIRKCREKAVHEHLIRMGDLVQRGWQKAAKAAGVEIAVSGMKPMSHFVFAGDKNRAMATLFSQEMLARGYLASLDFYATYAHTASHVEKYLRVCEEVFCIIAKAVKEGSVEAMLKGPTSRSDFSRLT